jgi:hypothetical protein
MESEVLYEEVYNDLLSAFHKEILIDSRKNIYNIVQPQKPQLCNDESLKDSINSVEKSIPDLDFLHYQLCRKVSFNNRKFSSFKAPTHIINECSLNNSGKEEAKTLRDSVNDDVCDILDTSE